MSVLARKRRREEPPPVRAERPLTDPGRGRLDFYADGLADGVETALNQLDGRGALSPDGVYAGPMPQELVDWIATTRRRLAEQRGQRSRTPTSGGTS